MKKKPRQIWRGFFVSIYLSLLLLQQVANLGEQFLLSGTLRLVRCRSRLFLLAVQLVDTFQHQENTEGYDDEVY